jgi:hypothetical protein
MTHAIDRDPTRGRLRKTRRATNTKMRPQPAGRLGPLVRRVSCADKQTRFGTFPRHRQWQIASCFSLGRPAGSFAVAPSGRCWSRREWERGPDGVGALLTEVREPAADGLCQFGAAQFRQIFSFRLSRSSSACCRPASSSQLVSLEFGAGLCSAFSVLARLRTRCFGTEGSPGREVDISPSISLGPVNACWALQGLPPSDTAARNKPE